MAIREKVCDPSNEGEGARKSMKKHEHDEKYPRENRIVGFVAGLPKSRRKKPHERKEALREKRPTFDSLTESTLRRRKPKTILAGTLNFLNRKNENDVKAPSKETER